MESYQELVSVIALTMGVAWSSGINLYAAILVLGLGSLSGMMELPEGLRVVESPLVLLAASFMFVTEFIADKVPGVDSGWDAIHTFIRIPAGAALAAASVAELSPELSIAAAIVGGTVAGTSHFAKAGSRVLINTSPEPVSNWTASITEDLLVIGGLWTALNYPWLFLLAFVAFMILMIWLLPKLWRVIKAIFRRIGEILGLRERNR